MYKIFLIHLSEGVKFVPKTVVFAFWPLFFHVIVVLDVLVERTVESHLLGQTLLDDTHAGRIGVAHDDCRLNVGVTHTGKSQQQQILVIELGVLLTGARHDVVMLHVDVVIELHPIVTVAVLELDDALHILGNTVVGLVITGVNHLAHHAHV